ncbi:unnamed protein product, partial [marine sediment metagenome]
QSNTRKNQPDPVHKLQKVQYWIDVDGNKEIIESHTLRIDYSPPKLALIIPEEGKVYLFG